MIIIITKTKEIENMKLIYISFALQIKKYFVILKIDITKFDFVRIASTKIIKGLVLIQKLFKSIKLCSDSSKIEVEQD